MSGEWPCNSWPATIELVELSPWRWRGGAGLHSHHRPLSSTFEHKCCWPKIQIFRPLVSPPAAGDPRWSAKRPGSSGGYRGALLPQPSPSHEWLSNCRSRPSRLFVEKKKRRKHPLSIDTTPLMPSFSQNRAQEMAITWSEPVEGLNEFWVFSYSMS